MACINEDGHASGEARAAFLAAHLREGRPGRPREWHAARAAVRPQCKAGLPKAQPGLPGGQPRRCVRRLPQRVRGQQLLPRPLRRWQGPQRWEVPQPRAARPCSRKPWQPWARRVQRRLRKPRVGHAWAAKRSRPWWGTWGTRPWSAKARHAHPRVGRHACCAGPTCGGPRVWPRGRLRRRQPAWVVLLRLPKRWRWRLVRTRGRRLRPKQALLRQPIRARRLWRRRQVRVRRVLRSSKLTPWRRDIRLRLRQRRLRRRCRRPSEAWCRAAKARCSAGKTWRAPARRGGSGGRRAGRRARRLQHARLYLFQCHRPRAPAQAGARAPLRRRSWPPACTPGAHVHRILCWRPRMPRRRQRRDGGAAHGQEPRRAALVGFLRKPRTQPRAPRRHRRRRRRGPPGSARPDSVPAVRRRAQLLPEPQAPMRRARLRRKGRGRTAGIQPEPQASERGAGLGREGRRRAMVAGRCWARAAI